MPHEKILSDEVFTILRRINREIEVNSKRLGFQYGLTGTQFLILRELNRLEKTSVGSLAERISLSSGTVTDILDRLEKKGFLERTRSTNDKRRVDVKITEKGRGILEKTPPTLQEHFKKEFEKLQDWEKTLLLSSLQRIAEMMESKKTKTIHRGKKSSTETL